MPVLWIDSCDDRDSMSSGNGGATHPDYGRHGAGWRVTGYTDSRQYGFPAELNPVDSITMGAAVRIPHLGYQPNAVTVGQGVFHVIGYYDWPTASNAITQAGLLVLNNGQVYLFRGFSGPSEITRSAPGAFPADSWVYLEWKITQDRVNMNLGHTTVRINNTVVIDYVGNVCSNTSGYGYMGPYSHCEIGGYQPYDASGADYDDIYVAYGDDFDMLGDSVVTDLYPNDNGASSQWLGSDGNTIDNYKLIDEVGGIGSDTVRATLPGLRDLYNLQNITNVGRVHAVSHVAWVNKSDSGPAAFRILNGGLTVTAGPILAPATSGRAFLHTLETNPDTGLAWTEEEINALQTGIETPPA